MPKYSYKHIHYINIFIYLITIDILNHCSMVYLSVCDFILFQILDKEVIITEFIEIININSIIEYAVIIMVLILIVFLSLFLILLLIELYFIIDFGLNTSLTVSEISWKCVFIICLVYVLIEDKIKLDQLWLDLLFVLNLKIVVFEYLMVIEIGETLFW